MFKKLLLSIGTLLVASTCFAQQFSGGGQPVKEFTGSVPASCTRKTVLVNTADGSLYSCPNGVPVAVGPGAAGTAAFNTVTTGTNTTATMTVGAGGTITFTSTGVVNANQFKGNAIIAGADGGTGNGFFAVSGPAGSLKTYALPNASTTILTTNTAVTVAQGGTNLASGTSGGVLAFTGATTLASSGALSVGDPVIGGGAGAVPTSGTRSGNTTVFAVVSGTLTNGNCVTSDASHNLVDAGAPCGSGGGSSAFSALTTSTNTTATMTVGTGATLTVSGSGVINATQFNGNAAIAAIDIASLPTSQIGSGTFTLTGARFANNGTANTVLHGNAAGNLPFSGVDLQNDVFNTLPAGNGGTNNAFFQVSGPATSVKTYTLPNASTTILTTNAAVTVPQGGTGIASGTSGGILYYSSSTSLSSTAVLSANAPIIGGGAGVAPSSGSRSGNTTTFVTSSGTLTSGTCAQFDANGNIATSGSACGSGGGNTTSTSLTTNTIPKANGANSIIDSKFTDDGTNGAYVGTGSFSAAQFVTTGTGPDDYTEQAAPASPAASHLYCWADSTDHVLHCKNSSGTIGTTVVADVGATDNFLTGISAAGVITKAQPTISNLAAFSSASLLAKISDETGSSLLVFNTSPLLVTPKVTTITDANGSPFILSTATASAVDSITVTNAAAANPATVVIGSSGSDTNINLRLVAKGTGVLQLGSTNATVDASGNLLVVSCTGCGTGGGSVALSGLTSATASSTLTNGDNPITWQWAATTSGRSAFTFGESTAGTSAGTPYLVNIQTLATSTLNPLVVTAVGTANGVQVLKSGFLSSKGTGGVDSGMLYCDVSTSTKCIQNVLSGISSATTRAVTWPDTDLTVVGTTIAQTLTNKTISGGSNTLTNIAGGSMVNNTVTATQLAVVQTRRVCDMYIGDTSGSVLTNGQLGPQKRMCFIPYAATVVEIDISADGGTPNVIVGRNRAGTTTNLLSSALATAASGGIACANASGSTGLDGATTCSSTLQNTGTNIGDYFELVSGTAGGTAKNMTVHVVYTVN